MRQLYLQTAVETVVQRCDEAVDIAYLVRLTPLSPPNRASGPQNHAMAKVATCSGSAAAAARATASSGANAEPSASLGKSVILGCPFVSVARKFKPRAMSKRARGADLVLKAMASPSRSGTNSPGRSTDDAAEDAAAASPVARPTEDEPRGDDLEFDGDAVGAPAAKVTKRLDYLKWDDYFMAVAVLSAKRSKGALRADFQPTFPPIELYAAARQRARCVCLRCPV